MCTIASGVNCIIGSKSQDKQPIFTSKCVIKIRFIARFTNNSLNSEINKINQIITITFTFTNTHNNGSFVSC